MSTESPADKIREGLEQVRCAIGNLENLGKVTCLGVKMKAHPFWKIVDMQLKTAEKILSGKCLDE